MTIGAMHWNLIFHAILVFTTVIQCGPAIKVESVIRTSPGLPITKPVGWEYDSVPIIIPDLTPDYFVAGELMPFWPLDGCSKLSPSQYTTTKDGITKFNPAVPGASVITIMQDGNCSLDVKMAMADQTENVLGVLILNSNDELPPKIDLYFYNSNLSAFLIKQSTGSNLILIADWYRSHKIRSDAANLSTLALPDITADGHIVLPPDFSEQTPLSLSLSTTEPNDHEYYDGWLSATFYYLKPESGSSMFGLVEFSLILVVVLLTVAFLTSIILHCYFYRLRVRRARLGELGGGAEELGQGGRQLLVADQLSFLPKSSYSEFHQARIKLNEELAANSKILTSKSIQGIDTEEKTDAASSSTATEEEQTMPKPPSSSRPTRLHAPLVETGVTHALGSSTSQLFISLNDTCPICLEEFENAEELRQLPCHHLYHPLCIDDWLMIKSAKCPMCKFDVYEAIKRMEEAKAQAQSATESPTTLPNARNRMEKMMAWFQSKWGHGRAVLEPRIGSGMDPTRQRPVATTRIRPRSGSRSLSDGVEGRGQEPTSPEQ